MQVVSKIMKWLLSSNVFLWALLAATDGYGTEPTTWIVFQVLLYMFLAAQVIAIIFSAPESKSDENIS